MTGVLVTGPETNRYNIKFNYWAAGRIQQMNRRHYSDSIDELRTSSNPHVAEDENDDGGGPGKKGKAVAC